MTAPAPLPDDLLADTGERVQTVLHALRAELMSPPADPVADRHLAAMATQAAASAHAAPSPPPVRAPRRGLIRLRRISALTAAKLALAAGVAAAATGGLAAGGVLPNPVQRAVAETAERIGITLPSFGDGPQTSADDAPIDPARENAPRAERPAILGPAAETPAEPPTPRLREWERPRFADDLPATAAGDTARPSQADQGPDAGRRTGERAGEQRDRGPAGDPGQDDASRASDDARERSGTARPTAEPDPPAGARGGDGQRSNAHQPPGPPAVDAAGEPPDAGQGETGAEGGSRDPGGDAEQRGGRP